MPARKTPSVTKKQPLGKTQFFLITLFAFFLVLTTAAGLVYTGFWYGQKMTRKQVESQEVPFGDEDLETDKEYQEAMAEYRDEGCTGETCAWMTYTNDKYGFSFQYPSTVFLEETDGETYALVYLDTNLIIVPEVYGGFLTPIEIRFESNRTVSEKLKEAEDLFYMDTLIQNSLPQPLKGVRIKGTMQGMYDGEELEEVFVEASGGIIVVTYLPFSSFPQDIFEKILQSLTLNN